MSAAWAVNARKVVGMPTCRGTGRLPAMKTIALPKIDDTVRPDFPLRQFNFRFGTAGYDTAKWVMRLGTHDDERVQIAHGLAGMTGRDAIFAAHPDSAFLITTDERIERLDGALPPGIIVLDKRPRFMQKGDVLLLGRETNAATARKQHAADASPAPF